MFSTVLSHSQHDGPSPKKLATDRARFDIPVWYNGEGDSATETRALAVTPYRKSVYREILFFVLSVLTAGVFPLIASWFPLALHKSRFVKVSDVLSARRCLVVGDDKTTTVVHCKVIYVSAAELRRACPSFSRAQREKLTAWGSVAYEQALRDARATVPTVRFQYRCCSFVYNVWSHTFEPLSFDVSVPSTQIHSLYGRGVENGGIREERHALYGRACVEVPVQPLHALIAAEIFHPFYIFQVAAVSLWLWDGYYQYATAIIVIMIVSLFAEIIDMYRTQRKLQKMTKFVCEVNVLSQGSEGCTSQSRPSMVPVSSASLVPGDIIEVADNMTLTCDLLLLQGSVLVNESMLTGESVPVAKSALPNVPKAVAPLFDPRNNIAHILYGGTDVVTTRRARGGSLEVFGVAHDAPLALVLQTGFSTAQGQMMRSVLHPPPSDRADFKVETYKFLGMLTVLACCGASLSIYLSLRNGLLPQVVFLRALDTFPNAIPPSLTAAMTVGCSVAVAKLRTFWRILCIAPSRVNVAGQVNTFVFDKTGTLTEEGLELDGIAYSKLLRTWYDSSGTNASSPGGCTTSSPALLSSFTSVSSEVPSILRSAMACCHSVMVVNKTFSGEPMEIQMLRFVGWSISEDPLVLPFHHGASQRSPELTLDRALPCVAEVYRKVAARSHSTKEYDLLTDVAVPQQEHYSTAFRIVKRFEFSSSLQRMSVLAWDRKRHQLYVFCKGSPEQIRERCLPYSVPSDFSQSLRRYTESGMRVLAFGIKRLSLNNPRWLKVVGAQCESAACLEAVELYSREEAETDLVFAGLTVFNNMLKEESRATIEELREAGCRCFIATGDNALTAAAVARDASIIDPTSEMIILGDVVGTPLCVSSTDCLGARKDDALDYHQHSECRIVWTPVLYSPTVDTLARGGESQHPSAIPATVTPSRNIQHTTSSASLIKQDLRPACSFSYYLDDDALSLPSGTADDGDLDTGSAKENVVVTLEDLSKQSRPPDLASGYYTSSEIQEYLNGKDPREVVMVLTGPAFRLLKAQRENLNIPWSTAQTNFSRSAPQPPGIREAWRSASKTGSKTEEATVSTDAASSWGLMNHYTKWSGSSLLSLKNLIFQHTSEEQGTARTSRRSSQEAFLAAAQPDLEADCDNETFRKPTPLDPAGRLYGRPQQGGASLRIAVFSHSGTKQTATTAKHDKTTRLPEHFAKEPDSLVHQLAAQLSVVQRNSLCSTPVDLSLPCDVAYVELSFFEFCLRYCRVYARMSPDDKAALITSIRSLPASPVVGMCGDGANDCSALRVADLGLSLSDKEASIAAPFTSARKSVKSSVDLLREARGALVNSFQSFKFIALYAMLQLATSLTLYAFGCNLTDPQYLCVDLAVVLPLSMTMAWTHASSKLASRLPLRRLVGVPVIMSLVGQILIQVIFVVLAVGMLMWASFYIPYHADTTKDRYDPDALRGYENTVVFLVSIFQYITTSAVLAMGRPWRKHIFTNVMYTTILVTLTSLSIILLLAPQWIYVISNWLSIVDLEFAFRLKLAGLVAVNCLVTYSYEKYVISGWATRREEAKDRATHMIDSTLPLDRAHSVRFDNRMFS